MFKTDTVHVVVFSCVSWFEGEVVVRFVDIGRIVGHHCLNFLFITNNTIILYVKHILDTVSRKSMKDILQWSKEIKSKWQNNDRSTKQFTEERAYLTYTSCHHRKCRTFSFSDIVARFYSRSVTSSSSTIPFRNKTVT